MADITSDQDLELELDFVWSALAEVYAVALSNHFL